jgi:hypothetical protein
MLINGLPGHSTVSDSAVKKLWLRIDEQFHFMPRQRFFLHGGGGDCTTQQFPSGNPAEVDRIIEHGPGQFNNDYTAAVILKQLLLLGLSQHDPTPRASIAARKVSQTA